MRDHDDERDFYWSLLNLGLAEDLEGLLEQALDLILRVVGAHRGYLELTDPSGDGSWGRSSALRSDEVDEVRRSLSTAIMREALQSGETIQTASALHDPRFRQRESVQRHQIEAAVCAPIGQDPPLGVLYLQGRSEPGAFDAHHVARIELFARHLAPYADRMVRLAVDSVDPTARLREQIRCEGLVGRSLAMANLLNDIALVAPLDLSVLLQGETGTGKTAVATVLHDNSPRRHQPFIELNCAAIPDELLESELFGAERGAHSTALSRVVGKVEGAGAGTLFLDEVAELPLASQAKLLQLLQSGRYYSLGSPTPRMCKARIITATNVDLKEAVATKVFRADLYYRLNVFTLRIPGLDERGNDKVVLARHFLNSAIQRHSLPNMFLSPSARHALQAAEFPGHLRELANVVERGCILAAGAGAFQITRSHLFPMDRRRAETRPRTYAEHHRLFQHSLIEATLEGERGNVSAAARKLDITRSHLYNLMALLQITPQRD